MMKALIPSLCALCLGFALAEVEPYVKLDMAGMESSEGWRMTVQPKEGEYVLAYFRDFGNTAGSHNDAEPLREIRRLIRTSGAGYSEDIVCNYDASAKKLSLLNVMGQRVEMKLPYLLKSSGSSSLRSVSRHFYFGDAVTNPKEWRSFHLGLKVISGPEAKLLASLAGIPLPDSDRGVWSVTLPPDAGEPR